MNPEEPRPRQRVAAAVPTPDGRLVLVPWSLVRAECARLRAAGELRGEAARADVALRRLARRLYPELFPD